MTRKPWKRIEPTTVTKVGWRTITTKTFIDPEGVQHSFDTVGKEGERNAAIIALTPENKVIIARQLRMGPEIEMDELPGGGVNVGEDPEVAIKRELLEETGYEAGEVTFLGTCIYGAYTNATSYVYMAKNCKKISEQNLDFEESIEVKLISVEELINNAKKGLMTDLFAVLVAYDELVKLA